MGKSTPENKVKEQIKYFLTQKRAFYFSAAAGPYTTNGVADIVGHYKGTFFAIECKRPGGKPTALQVDWGKRVESLGGRWFLFDGDLSEIKQWMVTIDMGV